MKIALLTDGIYPLQIGGMQKHSWNLANYLAAAGNEITVFYPAPKTNYRGKRVFTADAINEVALPWPKPGKLPGHYIRANKKFSTDIAGAPHNWHNYDLIYAQGFTAYGFFKNKKKRNRYPPIIVNLHGLEMFRSSFGLRDKLEKYLLRPIAEYVLREADAVVSLGGELTSILANVTGKEKKILEIPIGIERSWFVPREQSKDLNLRTFTFLGRYEPRKGIDLLQNVIKNLTNEEKARAIFRFIGPIPADKQLKEENVQYTGQINEEQKIMQFLSASDILVLPSYAEGMPTVILEAMARGNAIVATKTGATQCLVNDDNGWLIEAGNESALSEAISNAIILPHEMLERKQEKSLEKARRYEWSAVTQLSLTAFEEVIKERAPQDWAHQYFSSL